MIQRFRENAKSHMQQNVSAFWASNPFSEAPWEADERNCHPPGVSIRGIPLHFASRRDEKDGSRCGLVAKLTTRAN